MAMLNVKQIQWIRTNIRNRGIETIDLEYEIVDHVSSAVEEKLAEGVSFIDAYKSVVNAFGPFGFKKLQSQKYAKLRKKGRRMIFQNMKSYFKFPKIALPFLIASILYSLYSYFDYDMYLFYGVIVFTLFTPMVYFISSKQRRKIRENYTSVKAMHQINNGIFMTYYIFINPIVVRGLELPIAWLMVLSMIGVILALALFTSINQSISNIKNQFLEFDLA